jgi:hypothetical protein
MTYELGRIASSTANGSWENYHVVHHNFVFEVKVIPPPPIILLVVYEFQMLGYGLTWEFIA